VLAVAEIDGPQPDRIDKPLNPGPVRLRCGEEHVGLVVAEPRVSEVSTPSELKTRAYLTSRTFDVTDS